MQTNFLLGTLELTDEARMALKRLPYDLVCRHAINEHGIITKREREQNELSMRTIGPVRSRYMVNPTDPATKFVRVETVATWAKTIISLED